VSVIEVDVSTRGLEFDEVAETLDKELRQMFVERLADVAYAEAFYGAPWKTGKLARSIVKEIDEDGEASIKALAPYAIYVVKGTSPHEIRPVNASVLAFKAMSGDMVFTRLVRHPGTKPNPFLQRAVDKARENVEEIFAELFEELIG
jgi:HK97 gp10 family phage protein